MPQVARGHTGIAQGRGGRRPPPEHVLLFVFDFAAVLERHPALALAVGLAGSAVLLALGLRALRRSRGKAAREQPSAAESTSLPRLALDACLVAATNPAIFLLFAGVVSAATSLFPAPLVHAHLPALLLAMEAGVVGWLGALVWLTARLRGRVSERRQLQLDAVSGVLLAAFGLVLPVRLLAGQWR